MNRKCEVDIEHCNWDAVALKAMLLNELQLPVEYPWTDGEVTMVASLDHVAEWDHVESHASENESAAAALAEALVMSVAVGELVDDEWQRDEHAVVLATSPVDVCCVLRWTLVSS